jgi:hypothetical protein
MPEEIQQDNQAQSQENPIYKFMRSNNLTKLDEKTFLDTYSKPEKAKEIHSFMVSNDLTKLDESKFYDSYLKKKDQTLPSGEISSLTELPSSFIEPLKKGVAPSKNIGEEKAIKELGVKPYTGVTTPTNLPKQDALRYEKELKVKDAAINTLTDVYKQKGLKFDPLKPAAQKQIQDYIEREQNNDLGLVEGIRDKKPYLTRTTGLGETLYNTSIESFKEPIKSTKINTISNPNELADVLDEEIKNTPNVPESVPSNIGGYLVQLAGALPKLGAEEFIGGQGLVAAEMYWNGIASQRKALYQKGLDQGMDRVKAAQMAMDNATTSAIPDFVIGALLGAGAKGQAGILKQGTADAFKDVMKNVVKSSPKMFALGAGAEFGRAEAQKQAGYKVDRTEEVDNMFRGGGDLAKMDAAFKTAMAAPYVPKILYSAAKNVLSETPKPVLDALSQKYGDNGKVVDDVNKFAQTKSEVQDLVPEAKVASVTGLTEKVKNIQQDIDDLTARRGKTTDALKPQIDAWIKEYQDEINFYNKQINKVVESKDPTGVTEEVDDITGQKIGTKQYVVDGKEVSQEEFEAMQNKPVGTKEFVTAEVKPTEVPMEVKPIEGIAYHGDTGKSESSGYTYLGDKNLAKSYAEENGGKVKEIKYKLEKPFVVDSDAKSKIISDLAEDFQKNNPKSKWHPDTTNFINEKLKELGYDGLVIKKEALDTEYGYEKIGGTYGDPQIILFPKAAEVKPTEVKEEVKVKAPTKELAEGESVEFKTPEGKKIVGEKVIIPGFEKIDMVMVKDGLNNTVYDLASGMPMVEGDFSKEGAIKSIKEQLDKRNITQPKIYGLIYKSTNTSSLENSKNRVPQINPSSMFESYSEKRKAFEKEEYEKLPLKFNPEEIKKLKELKKRADDFGIDKMAKEIEGAIITRAKEGTFKPKTDYYEGLLKRDIEEKIKKEAEDKGVPYPKEYMKESPRITMDRLKEIINEGFKRDKFESIPEDVRKIMLDGYQKNIDILNKYGYYPDEKTKTFFDKLYQYVAAQTKRENRESQIAEAKKELISALDYLNKAHEKEFGKKTEAEVKPKEGEVKVYNAKDLKANPEVLENDENYHTLTYPKSFVRLSTNMLALKLNGLENSKIGDVINIFKKDYVINGFIENKKNPNEAKVLLIRVDKDGNLLREQDLSKKEQKEGKAKEFEEEDVEVEKPELTKDDLKKAEAKFAAAEDKFKKARNKIEDTQVKQAGMFGGEQKGMFAMGGEEAKKTLDPLRKAAKEAKAELDDIRNKIKVQEQAQPELKPIESKTDEEFIDNKIKLIKQQGKPLSEFKVGDKVFWASDWSKNWKQYSEGTIVKAGADYQIKRFSEHPESKRFKIFNLRSNDKVMLKPEGEANYTGKESISKTKEEVTPYQKALKEKQEAERRLTRQIAGEKAGITRNVIKEASKIEPSDARSAALKYLAGANLSREAIDEVSGNVKRARLNTGERELKSEEARLRDYVAKKGEGDDLNEAVHSIWEDLHGVSEELSGIDDREIKDALMQAISEYKTKSEAAQALIDSYSEVDLDAQEAAFYERYNITEDEVDAELAKLEPTLDKIGDDDYNFGKVPDEHINNLIEQYETEIERQAEQPSERGKEKIAEKVSARETGKPEEAKSVEEAYKDLTKIEKRQIINSKFDELLKELKIEKICPTD